MTSQQAIKYNKETTIAGILFGVDHNMGQLKRSYRKTDNNFMLHKYKQKLVATIGVQYNDQLSSYSYRVIGGTCCIL